MAESWSSCVNLAIVHPMIYPELRRGGDKGHLINTLRKLATDVFFGAMEITWYESADDSTRREIRDLLETSGVEVIYNAGMVACDENIDLNAADEETRRMATGRVMELIDDAYFYNARLLYIPSGFDPHQRERETAKCALVDSLKTLCRYAVQKATNHTLGLALEQLDREVQLKRLIGPTREAIEIAKAVNSEYGDFGLVLDTSHLPLLGETFEEAVSIAIDYLVHVHFANCIYSAKAKDHPYYGDRHPRFCVEHGEYDLEDVTMFITHLAKVGYFDKKTATTLPPISIETKPMEHEDPELVLAHEKRVFQQAWSKYERAQAS